MDMDTTGHWRVLLACPNDGVVATSGARSHVDFKFSLDHIMYECRDNMHLTQIVQHNVMTKSVRVDMEQFKNSHRIINQELRDWPLDNLRRRNLSILAFCNAKMLVARSMSPQHNILIIPYQLRLVSTRLVIDESRSMELMAQLSMEDIAADCGMVPTVDSFVESLKIRTSTSCEDGESCPICLEDFYVDCQVLSMPCCHNFHEHCIKKWLKYSHYCPTCRFEMPTKT